MRELTACQMSEMEGRHWGLGDFTEGFLCGAGVLGLIAIWMSPEPVSRWALWGVLTATLASCAVAFFD